MREISQLVCIYYAGLLAGKPQNLLLAYQKNMGKTIATTSNIMNTNKYGITQEINLKLKYFYFK